MISTEDVVRATGGILLNGDMGVSFTGVSHDTRTIKPGELFVAIKGPRFDGHDFVLEAIENGARGLLVSHWPEEINIFKLHKAISVIKVSDTVKALEDLAAYWRKKLKAKVIAISGTCGKTTTKEILATLLEDYQTFKTPWNWNNLIGLPLTILNTLPEAEFLVLELGTNLPGEIARLTEIASPEVAIFLGSAPSHLEGLGTPENVFKEEIDVFVKAPQAVWVYPYDQKEVKEHVYSLKHKGREISFGFEEGSDLRGRILSVSLKGTRVKISFEGEDYDVEIPLLGRPFVFDTLAALAGALAAGLSLPELLPKLEKLKPAPHRMEVKQAGGIIILDDTYNANPASFKAAAEVLKAIRQEFSRVVAVVGDMKELGEKAPFYHEEVGRVLAQVCDQILAVGKYARDIARGGGEKVNVFSDKEALFSALRSVVNQGSLVFVKGSRAMAMEKIVDWLLEEKT
ncbi:UDP-N-acetylmuramoyl-tripeptide--D-alanyl-D-alanine ligase [Thermodesulfatator indicus]